MIESYDVHEKNPYGERVSTQALAAPIGCKTVSLAIPADRELPLHTTPTPALLIVIEGRARFEAGDQEIRLAAGTVVHIPPGVPHRIVAIEDSHCLLVR